VQPLQLVGPSYVARSVNFDASRTINLYPEASESGQSKSIAMLVGCPGLVRFATLAGGGIRGTLRFSATVAIVVAGANVYMVNTAGAGTLIGTVDALTTPVSMASNGTVVMLVTGPSGYVVTPASSSVAQIVDSDFTGADRVDFIAGYFVFNKPGTQQFQITGLYSTGIDPLDFASAEGAPDMLISLICDHKEVWLFGETTTEVFFNSGNPDFPFEPIQGVLIQQGCGAKNSPARFAGGVAWLAQNEQGFGMVVQSNGYQPKRISNHAVELAIQGYTRVDDAVAFSYQVEGHEFYVITFPTANNTWAYDANTQLWHERQWRNSADASMNRHRAQCMMAFAGDVIVGDWESPYLYRWDLDTYTDDGGILPAIRQIPHQASSDNTYQFFHKLWLDMQTGIGLNGTVQGSDPMVSLSWSDDGGASFGTEMWAPAGKLGERKRRVNYRRLGKSRDRVFRLLMTDPVKRAWIGVGCDMTEGVG
jgi:hypothetical protein